MAPKVKLGPITVTDTPATDPFDDFLEALATNQPGAVAGMGLAPFGQGALAQAQGIGAGRAAGRARADEVLRGAELPNTVLDAQTIAGQQAINPNFSVGALPTAQPLAASERAALQEQANQGAQQQDGVNPMALAALAGQLPQFGAQVGRFINTLSDERVKTNISTADNALEAFLTAIGG